MTEKGMDRTPGPFQRIRRRGDAPGNRRDELRLPYFTAVAEVGTFVGALESC